MSFEIIITLCDKTEGLKKAKIRETQKEEA